MSMNRTPSLNKSGSARERLSVAMSKRMAFCDLEGERIKVIVRVRPPKPHEHGDGVVEYLDDGRIVLNRPDAPVASTEFKFDKVLQPGATQHEVYMSGVKDVVDDVLNGYNGTIMAYGQTGAGKTYTISNVDPNAIGMNTRCVAEIFYQASMDFSHTYIVTMSYIQVYMEMIQDLLHPESDNLPIREDSNKGVYVAGLKEVPVNSLEECLQLLSAGAQNRLQNFTHLNAHSSASHAIVTLTVVKRRRPKGPVDDSQAPKATVGKLFLVDLAGSERLKKSKSVGVQAQYAASINLSLTTMGMCINARAMDEKHVPFRDSKLTRILQDSLGGNCRTTLLVNVAAVQEHAHETLQSLQFASRAMNVRVKPQVNVCHDIKTLDDSGANLMAMQREMVAAMARKEVEMSAAFEDALHKERKRTEQLIEDAVKNVAPVQAGNPDLEARVAALEERVRLVEEQCAQTAKLNAQLNDLLKADTLDRRRLTEEERDKAAKDAAAQRATLLALMNLQQSLQQIDVQCPSASSSAAERQAGLGTAAATLAALRPCPQDAHPGLNAAAAVLTQLSESPEAAAEKPGMEAAAASVAAEGVNPSDATHRQGFAAAAAALRLMAKNAKAGGSQPQGMAAATQLLAQKGIDPRDPALAPGLAAAARALHAMAKDPRTPPSCVPGVAQGAGTLTALTTDPTNAAQQPGLAAADVALARMEASCAATSPELAGIQAVRKALGAMDGRGSDGAPASKTGGAAAAAALAAGGVCAWDAKHQPGFDAAIAKLEALQAEAAAAAAAAGHSQGAALKAGGTGVYGTATSLSALHAQSMQQAGLANGEVELTNQELKEALEALANTTDALGEHVALDRENHKRVLAAKSREADVLKQHLGGVHQRLEDLDQQVQQMRSEQERAEREREQALEKERIMQAGQTMVALGVDLSDAKHSPGVEMAVAALTSLANTPPSAAVQQGVQTAASTLRKMAEDPDGAAQDRAIDAATAALEAKGIDPTDVTHAPGMMAAFMALSALGQAPLEGSDGGVAAAAAALKDAGITPYDEKHQPGLDAAAAALTALADDPCHEARKPGLLLACHVLNAIRSNPADEQHQAGVSASSSIVTSLTMLGSPGHAADQPGTMAAQTILAALCIDNENKGREVSVSAAHAACTAKGINPNDPVYQRGILAAAATLTALSTNTKSDGSTINMYNTFNTSLMHSAGIRDMMNQRMMEGLIKFNLPKPDFGPIRKDTQGEDETEDEEAAAAAAAAAAAEQERRDEELAAQSAHLASLEQQMQQAQQGLACTMAALGIASSEVTRDPEAAIAATRPMVNEELCKELASRNEALATQMAELQKQAQETQRGADAALMALGIDKEAVARDPEAAAATASAVFNGRMFKDLASKVQELQAQQHTLTKNMSSAQMATLEKQLQDAQTGLAVALLALGIDPEELAHDPDAAASASLTFQNGAQLQDLSRKVKELQAQQKAISTQARLLEDRTSSSANLSEVQEALAEVGQRLDSLESDREALVSTTVRASDLKELENYLLERLGMQARACEQLNHTMDVIVADANKLALLHNVGAGTSAGAGGVDRPSPASKAISSTFGQYQPFTFTSVMQNYMTYDEMLERFAQKAGVKEFIEKTRANHELVLKAIKETDAILKQKHEATAKVLIRISQQVDYLHNKIRDVARGELEEAARGDSMPSLTITQGDGRHPLLSMGTMMRGSNMRNLVGSVQPAEEESVVDRALREAEAEKLDYLRSSSGGRRSNPRDALRRSLMRSIGGNDHAGHGHGADEEEPSAGQIKLDEDQGWASKASGLRGLSMAREPASRGWDMMERQRHSQDNGAPEYEGGHSERTSDPSRRKATPAEDLTTMTYQTYRSSKRTTRQ